MDGLDELVWWQAFQHCRSLGSIRWLHCKTGGFALFIQLEIHERVSGGEVVTVPAFPRMNERPLHLVLRNDLVELLLHLSNIFRELLRAATESTSARRY